MPEKLHGPERTAEHSKRNEALKQSVEHQASAEVHKQSSAERQHSVEVAREQLKVAERESQPTDREHRSEQPAERGEPKVVSRRERDAVFQSTMQQVRHQLTPAQRTFSRLVHAKPVEATSELLEETVFRTSFLWGGVIGGLIFGGALYLVARVQGFELSGSEFIIGLVLGGLIGFLIEKIWRRKREKTPVN